MLSLSLSLYIDTHTHTDNCLSTENRKKLKIKTEKLLRKDNPKKSWIYFTPFNIKQQITLLKLDFYINKLLSQNSLKYFNPDLQLWLPNPIQLK